MATLPTIPSFASNDSSLTNLQNLSQAVSFLVDMNARPMWHLYTGSTHTVAANTVITETFPLLVYDSDNMYDGTGITIQTSGYYAMEAAMDFTVGSPGNQKTMVWFQLTTGSNNPNFVAGTTKNFGGEGLTSGNFTTEDLAMCPADLCPYLLFPGDVLRVQYNSDTACTRQTNVNTNYMSGRFTPNFTGRMVRPA